MSMIPKVNWPAHLLHVAIAAPLSFLAIVVINIFVDVPATMVLVWLAVTMLAINQWSKRTGAING